MQPIPADAHIFTKLDAVHGYFQLALDKTYSNLTKKILSVILNTKELPWCYLLAQMKGVKSLTI